MSGCLCWLLDRVCGVQSLEAEMGLGAEAWASPESPFAQKAAEAYQAFVTRQKDDTKPGYAR